MYEEDYEHDQDAYAAAHIEWLKTATPDDWHRAVLAFQWSEAFDPLLWIVQQENCDKATALKIFWAMSPEMDDAKAVRAGRSDCWTSDNEIAEYIAKRLHTKGFKRAQIAFDAEPMMLGDYEHFQEEMRGLDDPLWRPHPDMIKSIRGREVTLGQGYDSPVPEAFAPVMIDLPPSDVVTPNMQVAFADLLNVLLTMAMLGAVIGFIPYTDFSGTSGLITGLSLLVAAVWAIFQITGSMAVVRSLLRENYSKARNPWVPLSMLVSGIAGAVAGRGFLRGKTIIADAGIAPAADLALDILVFVALVAAVWMLIRQATKYLILRKLFA